MTIEVINGLIIHVQYNDEEAVVGIPDGDVIEGSLRSSKMKLVQAWIELHRDVTLPVDSFKHPPIQ